MSIEISEGLPEADTPAEVLGTMHFVLNSLGRELGERYDAHLKASIGPNWAPALANIRHQKYINIYDPHFVLAEPLKYSDSPTRACLPSGGAFYNRLEVALDVRNAWSHHEITPLNLTTLKASVAAVHEFATAAEMKLGKLCSDVTKRINAIVKGTYPPPDSKPRSEPSVDIEALLAELAAARTGEDALKADVAAAKTLLDEAAQAGADKADLLAQLDTMQVKLEDALAEKQKLEFVIEALASSDSAEPISDDWMDVVPGHKWLFDIPSRRVTMMSLHPDLFDETTRERVAAEFGPQASASIAGWKATVAPNASVFLSPAGQAVTYISGVPIYLGSLNSCADLAKAPDQAVGFFSPHSYTLRLNGAIEDRESGAVLADVNPDASPQIAQRLLELIPTGGRLRVTTSGGVARHLNGDWQVVVHVDAGQWFPGHLVPDAAF